MKRPIRIKILNQDPRVKIENSQQTTVEDIDSIISPLETQIRVPEVAKPVQRASVHETNLNTSSLSSIRDSRHIFYKDELFSYEGKEFINDTQVKYVTAEKTTSDSAIPASLWQSTMKALENLKYEVVSINKFLQGKMDWTAEEVNEYLSPEQQDVLALMINQLDKGETPYNRGVLLGDTTGFGKGRPLMAYAAYCKKKGIRPIVFTLQDNLFSNLWADIIDMNLEHTFNRPLLINADASIEDTRTAGGKKIFKKIKSSELKQIIESGFVPEDFGIIMLTYSQLNMPKSARQSFLEDFVKNNESAIILDESQAIVEMTATTSSNVARILEKSYVSINSSATSARHIDNMSSYIHIYPWLSDLTSYESNFLDKEKRIWLSSLSVEKAVASGRMLRREHDMSGLELEIHLPDKHAIERFNKISDEFSVVCQKLIEFHSLISEKVDQLNLPQEGDDDIVTGPDGEQLSSTEYKSLPIFQRLHPVARQLLACMMSQHLVKRSVDSLLNNEKPFIVMDMTMEAAMSKIADENADSNDGEENDSEEDNSDLAQKPMTIKDLSKLALDKLCEVSFKKRGAKGKSETIKMSDKDIEGFNAYYQDVLDAINRLPELPASPIDYIKEEIERIGQEFYEAGKIEKPWTICEISGRSRHIKNNQYVSIEPESKNALISGYNSGKYDALVASRKASTGLSAHSSSKFADQRIRRMIEGIGCDNPIERKQMFGRIDRRGQIHRPRYETINIGIPYNMIKIATDNSKSIELSASVSASGEGGLIADIPNLLGNIANETAREILSKNADIAKKLKIFVSEENSDYSAPMFRRCFVLSSKEQNEILEEFKRVFAIKSKDFEGETKYNLGSEWSIVEQTLIEPGKEGLEDGLFLSKVEKKVNRNSFTSKNIPALVEMNPALDDRLNFLNVPFNKDKYLIQFKEPFIKSVKHGIASFGTSKFPAYSKNKIGTENKRLEDICFFLANARRGCHVYMKDQYGRKTPAIISSVVIPENNDLAYDWHQYIFNYVIPGERQVYRMSLDTIINSKGKYGLAKNRNSILKAFDEKGPGEGIESSYILQSDNPFALVMASQRANGGSLITWEDSSGVTRNSVMLSDAEVTKMMNIPGRIWSPNIAKSLIQKGETVMVGSGSNTTNLSRQGYDVVVTLPYMASERRVFNKIGFLCANMSNGNPKNIKFTIRDDQVDLFLEEIMKEYPLHYNNKNIDYVLSLEDGIEQPQRKRTRELLEI